MPFGDRTGPRGFGPMTGRGAGLCAGYAVPGPVAFAPGWVCRGGGGRGWRNQYYATGLTAWQRAGTAWPQGAGTPFEAPMSRELELSALKAQAENLAQTLDNIRNRIDTLEAQGRKGAQ